MPMSVSSTSSLIELQKLFPNAIQVNTRELATALRISPKTIDNHGDTFPIKPVRIGRNKFFRLIDIARYLDQSLGIEPDTTLPRALATGPAVSPVPQPVGKRAPGRPRNSEKQKGVA